jgi:hypothetical protein
LTHVSPFWKVFLFLAGHCASQPVQGKSLFRLSTRQTKLFIFALTEMAKNRANVTESHSLRIMVNLPVQEIVFS